MFSGIVQKVFYVNSIDFQKKIVPLSIYVDDKVIEYCKIGYSIAINGVCLTVTNRDFNTNIVVFQIVPETLQKTNLKNLVPDSEVNFELSLRLKDFVGGHLVQGHIDGVGTIKNIVINNDKSFVVSVSAMPNIIQNIVYKGFITIDGISLTVISVSKGYFDVVFIPHTLHETIAKNYIIGSVVNLENDVISKYIYNYMEKICEV